MSEAGQTSVLRSVEVTQKDFDVGVEYANLRGALGGGSGAIAAFCGLVRDRADDQSVSTLTLEHYPGMTEKSIEAIIDKAVARWPVTAVRVVHRVGEMSGGEQIVLVLTAAMHRVAAFEACQFLMDYLKTDAVFWKKETRDGQDRWIESTHDDVQRVADWRTGVD